MKILLVIIYCLFAIVVVPNAQAQEKKDFSISIDPSIIEVQATAPSTPQIKLKLSNKSEKAASLNLQILPFTLAVDGQVKYVPDSQASGNVSKVREKIKVYDVATPVTAVKLGPLESKLLDIQIEVDNKLPAGDYYLAIVFSSQSKAEAEKSTVATSGGIASLLLLSVSPGKTSGRIAEFSSPFITNGPVPFKLLVGNDSNHYIIPRGRIKITDMFGKNVGRVDILPQYVLSSSNRYLTDSKKAGISNQTLVWPERFLLGIYTAELTLNLSEEGPALTQTIRFISFPVLITLGVIVVVFVICGIIIKALRITRKH